MIHAINICAITYLDQFLGWRAIREYITHGLKREESRGGETLWI